MEILKGSGNTTNTLKVLVYGASGVGKTVFASTAPKPLFLNAEGGMLSIRDKNLDSVKIDTFLQVQEVLHFLKHEKHGYQTVVMDSLTEVVKKCMDTVLEESRRAIPTQQDWLKNVGHVRSMIRAYRDLPVNVIFIALRQESKDEAVGNVSYKPSVVGKVTEDVMGYVDEVFYLFTQESKDDKTKLERYLMTQPSDKFAAKDRSGRLERFEAPDFQAILGKVFSTNGKGGKS